MMRDLGAIASKADYIADVARAIDAGRASVSIIDKALLHDILIQLSDIADTLDEYNLEWQ